MTKKNTQHHIAWSFRRHVTYKEVTLLGSPPRASTALDLLIRASWPSLQGSDVER
jgi:hypothetical protein